MFTIIAIALSAISSDISHNVTTGPVYELAPITIVVEAPETPMRTFEVCLHVPGESAPRACGLFEDETIEEALSVGRAFFGPAGIVTAEVAK